MPARLLALFGRDRALRREPGAHLDVATRGEGRLPVVCALEKLTRLEVHVGKGKAAVAARKEHCPRVVLVAGIKPPHLREPDTRLFNAGIFFIVDAGVATPALLPIRRPGVLIQE
jgi:hypothetical protein